MKYQDRRGEPVDKQQLGLILGMISQKQAGEEPARAGGS